MEYINEFRPFSSSRSADGIMRYRSVPWVPADLIEVLGRLGENVAPRPWMSLGTMRYFKWGQICVSDGIFTPGAINVAPNTMHIYKVLGGSLTLHTPLLEVPDRFLPSETYCTAFQVRSAIVVHYPHCYIPVTGGATAFTFKVLHKTEMLRIPEEVIH